ncbi:MAG: hypothetical protein Kow0040_17010 [Thermogutta sp.]
MACRKPRASRRGVVLLLVLALLAVFGVVVLAFVVVTGFARRGAETAKLHQVQYDPPEKTVYQALMQVVRGSNNPASVIWCHSLLEDVFGDSVLEGNLTFASPPSGTGQIWAVNPLAASNPQRWVGGLLTLVNTPLAGETGRIVDYDGASGQWLVFSETISPAAIANVLSQGYTIRAVVNRDPFGGTGVGYDGSDTLAAADGNGLPFALLPNPSQGEFLNYWAGADRVPGTADDRPLSANEDYDAPDYQNMFLAMVVQDPANGNVLVPEPSYHRVALTAYWFQQAVNDRVPNINWGAISDPQDRFRALLRPEDPTLALPPPLQVQIARFKRKFILRPQRVFHPDFDGSNPDYLDGPVADSDSNGVPDRFVGELSGPWDVDNDGDGVPDSIWVDVGLPVRTLPDGRRYKPLAAILCTDLDGRLNLNAHGSLVQTDERYYQRDTANLDGVPQGVPWLLGTGGDTSGDALPDGDITLPPTNLPAGQLARAEARWVRGLGFGPAEINLGPLFQVLTGTSGASPAWRDAYARILIGQDVPPPTGPWAGRYGERLLWLAPPPPYPAAGITGQISPLLVNKYFMYPNDWRQTLWAPFGPGTATAYGSPPDMMGALEVGLDLRGRPIYMQPQALWTMAGLANPYKVDLTAKRNRHRVTAGQSEAVDAPFTPAELEAVLRPFDADGKNLAPRLRQLVPDIIRARHLVTTESWDVPAPGLAGSRRSRTAWGSQLPEHITQRFNVVNPQEWHVLFPPDLFAGLRLDLNRPLGDGQDNNADNVVDDVSEAFPEPGQDAWAYQTQTGPGPAVPFDYDGNGQPGSLEDPRQAYARHMYVLMMAVADLDYLDTLTGGSRLQTARMIAQWAVNVVDFRDRDSIMTRFAFDENPFDGWNPPNDSQHVVWGCERPELLISETLAFHDRRTEDLPAYGYAYNPPQPQDGEDQKGDQVRDLDQRYRPQGSLFVELYNPWFENEPPASELDTATTSPANPPGVDLTRTTPNGEPVWRLVIAPSEPDPNAPGLPRDPDDPDPGKRPEIERAAYFVPRPAAGFPEEATIKVSYYPGPNYASGIGKILPGRYAVVAPAGQPTGDRTFIGFQLDQPDPNTDRFIQVQPNAVTVSNNTSAGGDSVPPGVNPPVGIRMDRGYVSPTVALPPGVPNDKEMRLSVSEPVTGYDAIEISQVDEIGNTIQYNSATGRYEDPPGTVQVIDKPLDAQRNDLDSTLGQTWNDLLGRNGTTANFRVVYLQRLANPLLPYDPVLNPYRTIDAAAVDLTAFNGRDTAEDLSEDGSQVLSEADVMFHTRQRGERNDDVPDPNNGNTIDDANQFRILWKQEPGPKIVTDDPATAVTGRFNRRLKHTLSYLNERFGIPRPGPAPYNGDAVRPTPWLTWLNRPFTNPLELLLVPALPSSRLLAYDATNYYKYYRVPFDGTNPETDLNPYSPNPTAVPPDAAVDDDPYPHLLNFFWSVGAGMGGAAAPEFHRVLDFVRVPSPFVNTEFQMNPQAAGTLPSRFRPPYHVIPAYREPGKLNINTVYSPEIWRSLLNHPAGVYTQPNWADANDPLTAFWLQFLDSRRGYLVNGTAWLSRMLELNPDYPTRLGNPFRNFGGFSNVPPTSPVGGNNPSLQDMIEREVNATLLRPQVRYDNNRPEFTKTPLFQSPPTDPEDPSLNRESEYCDINRNPFFRYRDLMRLGNLATTRSNVYAVWVTIGYFEVEPITQATVPPGLTPQEIADIYPDGYRLGQELGSDSGEIKRHRGFFIVDRSLPVGFKRGRDLNVDKAILIKRILE